MGLGIQLRIHTLYRFIECNLLNAAHNLVVLIHTMHLTKLCNVQGAYFSLLGKKNCV